jgi:hypothetical protein
VVTNAELLATGRASCDVPAGEAFEVPDEWRSSMEVVDLFKFLTTLSEAADQHLC